MWAKIGDQKLCAVHFCAKHAVCAILLLEAWRHILCLWGAAVKMKVCLDWGFGTQACVCTSTNPKSKSVVLCLDCLVGSSLEDESAFGLRFWQVQKGVCSSLCLHIHKPKKKSRTESGFFKKKQPSCHAHCEEICVPPFPQFNAGKGFKKKQPFRLGCRHALGSNIDQGGAGDQV